MKIYNMHTKQKEDVMFFERDKDNIVISIRDEQVEIPMDILKGFIEDPNTKKAYIRY